MKKQQQAGRGCEVGLERSIKAQFVGRGQRIVVTMMGGEGGGLGSAKPQVSPRKCLRHGRYLVGHTIVKGSLRATLFGVTACDKR